jgi:hypothetical protein
VRAAATLGSFDATGAIVASAGALAVGLAVLISAERGATVLLLPLALLVFGAVVAAFVGWPHVAVAATIVYFTLIPTVNDFVTPLAGPTKDLIAFAAIGAACALFVQRRSGREGWAVDKPLLMLVAFFTALYIVNLGGGLTGESGHGLAWFHGVRLACEPLGLFVVGLSLRHPERTMRWGIRALVAAAAIVALFGLLQQSLGVAGLLELGYTYGQEVRQTGSNLRSFGTLDEPFSYATFLLVGLAALLLWSRLRWTTVGAALLLTVALYVSYVRTAALVALALAGIAIARRGHSRLALFTVVTSVVLGLTLFASASQQKSTRSVFLSSSEYVTLNGRTNIWQEQIGDSRTAWLFGRGVGAVGTAAQRATRSFVGRNQLNSRGRVEGVLDSGYFTVIADVGVLGLAVILALFGRLTYLAIGSGRRGERTGWVALGILAVILLDALTRDSFTGFPVPWIGFLLLGLAAATWASSQTVRAPLGAVQPG